MVCRATKGNSAITSYARYVSGVEDQQVLSMFHEVRANAPEDCAPPTDAEFRDFLGRTIERVTNDPDLREANRRSLLHRLNIALNSPAPDAETYYAWRTIEERAVRARAALDAQFDQIADRHGGTREEVAAAFSALFAENHRDYTARTAPRAPEHLAFETANLPHDRATGWALTMLHFGGLDTVSNGDGFSDRARQAATLRAQRYSDRAAATATAQCEHCGQFQGAAGVGHTCPNNPAIAAQVTEAALTGTATQADAASRIGYNPVTGQFVASDGTAVESFSVALDREVILAIRAEGTRAEEGMPEGVTVPALRDGAQRITQEGEQFVSSDGQRWSTRLNAMRRERVILAQAEQARLDANRPFGLREAMERLNETRDGWWGTSDGRQFPTRVFAIRHERTLSRDLPPANTLPVPDLANDADEALAGEHVWRDGEAWRTTGGGVYSDRTRAVAAEAEARRNFIDGNPDNMVPLQTARDRVRRGSVENTWVTSDGRVFDQDARILGIQHERTLGRQFASLMEHPTASPEEVRRAGHAVFADGDYWHTSDGTAYVNRDRAIQAQYAAMSGGTFAGSMTPNRCAACGQFAGNLHDCPGNPRSARPVRAGNPNLTREHLNALRDAPRVPAIPLQASPAPSPFFRDSRTETEAWLRENGLHSPATPQATDEALASLRERLVGTATANPAEAPTFVPGQRCDNCGQFTGPRHVCAENRDGEPGYTYDAEGNEIAPDWAPEAALSADGDITSSAADRAAAAAEQEWLRERVEAMSEDPGVQAILDAARGRLNSDGSAPLPVVHVPVVEPSPEDVLASATVTEVPDHRRTEAGRREAAERRVQRVRTPVRTYNGDHGSVQMTNVSQIRASLRTAGVGEPVDLGQITAHISGTPRTEIDGFTSTETYVVFGGLTATATSARSRGGRDRISVAQYANDEATGSRRGLRCTCPDYRRNYDCTHVRQAVEQVQALLNNRDAVAVAPVAAVEQTRTALHEEYQNSLTAQQQARADFNATAEGGTAYAEDMTAFQAAWDEAKARIEAGETALPYMTENATGGLGARDGGRSFGIEIEVDFPDDMSWTAKNRVAREIYEAGLSDSDQVRPWHWRGRQTDARGRRMGGGYTDNPNMWSVEFDRSVDDVGGQRGCEIVSPILYDEPHTWANLAKVCEIIERNGGRATPRTGLHINVGAADFDHTVENHNRLLRLSNAYEDVLVRLSHNPQSGPNHRGRAYCAPAQVPAEGYRRIRHAQAENGHRSMVNLDHVPAEGAPVTSSTRVEVRIFDGAVDPGRIQTNVKVALGLVNAATRGVEPGIEPEPAGTHRRRNVGENGRTRRLRGEEWTNDTASVRAFADAIFSRDEDKAQMVHAFASTRWQAR